MAEKIFCDNCGGECGNPWYASLKYFGDFCCKACQAAYDAAPTDRYTEIAERPKAV